MIGRVSTTPRVATAPSPWTLGRALLAAAAHPRGCSSGLRFVDRRERELYLPWVEVSARARAVAETLARSGVEAGETLPLVYGTGPDFFDAFFGAALCGAIPVPLYPPLRLGSSDDYPSRTSRLIAAVGARRVLAATALHERIAAVARSAGARLLVVPEPAKPSQRPEESEAESAIVESLPTDATRVALVQFSSGSTGEPRPVALSHAALQAQAERIGALLPDDPDRGGVQSGVSWLPLYHDMGLIGCVLPALDRPADLTLLAPEVFVARPVLWLRTLARYRATVSPAPTFAFQLCLERIPVDSPELAGVDLSAWRAALVGAETVVPSVLRRFAERFAPLGFSARALTPVYGLAEAALAVTTTPIGRGVVCTRFDRRALVERDQAIARPPETESTGSDTFPLVALGRPLPDFEVEIRDRGGRALREGEVGEVFCRGPSLMEGYLERPEATERALRGGWLATGDRGFLHDGELYLTGRAKDLLLVRGRNHPPEPIETAVSELADVGASVATSHVTEESSGEQLWLLVERRRRSVGGSPRSAPERDADWRADRELARRCRARALGASGLRCAAVVLVPPGWLPRTSSGKLRREAALRRFLEAPGPEVVVVPSDEVPHRTDATPSVRSAKGSRGARR